MKQRSTYKAAIAGTSKAWARAAVVLLVLAVVPGSGSCARDEVERPNIVLILADDLGWGDLGCYGATRIQTPQCDRLAREGVRFTDAHSSSAVCSPSRYSVLTGRYGWRTWLKNGVLQEHMPLLVETDRLTLPSLLDQHGYVSACIGKWHLGWGDHLDPDWNGEVSPGPLEVGFDYYFGVPYGHDSSPMRRVYVENRRVFGLRDGETLDDLQVLRRVQRRLDLTASRLSEAAVDFIEHNSDRPFFLYYATTNVHKPWTPDRRFLGTSEAGTYGDFVAEFDWAVGEIIGTLDELGLTERTLLIVTSDNGANADQSMHGHRPNGPFRGVKAGIYEGSHRVPFIARWPGRFTPGAVCTETICLTDLMATVAAIVGHPLPDDAAEDSYNILPALTGEPHDSPIRGAVIHHSSTGMFAIRDGKWKLIEGIGNGSLPLPELWEAARNASRYQPVRDPETGKWEDVYYDFPPSPAPQNGEAPGQLYDLEADPGETENLWRSHPDIVSRLSEMLDEYRRSGRSRP
jgi:arylsulfatase A